MVVLGQPSFRNLIHHMKKVFLTVEVFETTMLTNLYGKVIAWENRLSKLIRLDSFVAIHCPSLSIFELALGIVCRSERLGIFTAIVEDFVILSSGPRSLGPAQRTSIADRNQGCKFATIVAGMVARE